MFSNTIIGNVIHAEVVKSKYNEGEFLSLTLAVNDLKGNSIRVKFTNSNGLLSAYKNGTLVGGSQLILAQFDVKLDSIRSHYIKDGSLAELKYPEVSLTNVRAIISTRSSAKADPTLTAIQDSAPRQSVSI